MRIGNLEVCPGEKKSGWIAVEGTPYRMPVTVICGGGGKTTLITAGVHSAEHVGVQAAMELAEELQPEGLDGTVVLVPIVNVSGYGQRGTSMVWEDGKNLNREFPGSREGTTAEKICRTVTDVLFSAADYYIDLHSGDYFEELYPYVYYVGPAKESVRRTAKAMAACVDTAYAVESRTISGGAYNYANSIGIPAILLERGGRGLWSRKEVDADKKDVRRVLKFLYGDCPALFKTSGAESGPQGDISRKPQIVLTDVCYEDAPLGGCWYPAFKAGDRFEQCAVLGEIRDYFGNVLYTCRACKRGVLLYQTVSLNLPKGTPMVAYGVLG